MNNLLSQANLTKKQLADLLGIKPSTVYAWDEWPQYATAYLELYIELQEARELGRALDNFMRRQQG